MFRNHGFRNHGRARDLPTWSSRLLAVLLTGLAVGWAAPMAGSAAAAEPEGWSPVFAADFSAETLPEECTAFDGRPAGQAAAYYRPDETQISGGMLRLSIRRRDFADSPYTSGGLGCQGVVQLYGRYEFRARMAPGVGIDSYVTLWPEQGAESDVTVMEVSAEEGSAEKNPVEAVRVSNADGVGVTRKKAFGRYADGFHEYVVEWAPSGLRVFVDGALKIVDDRASLKPRWLGFAVSTGDEDSGLPSPKALPAEFLVDWVRAYAYTPGAPGLSAARPSSRDGLASGSERHAGGNPARSASPSTFSLVMTAVLALIGIFAALFRLRSSRSGKGKSSHRA